MALNEIETKFAASRNTIEKHAKALTDILNVCREKGIDDLAQTAESLLAEVDEWRRNRPAVK